QETTTSDKSAYQFNPRLQITAGTENVGSLFAVSAETGKTLWRYDQRAGFVSALTTGGGLVFIGDAHGHFKAFNDETGAVLWDMDAKDVVSGFPVTYTVNGKQYVAVTVGNGLTPTTLNTLTRELTQGTRNRVVVY